MLRVSVVLFLGMQLFPTNIYDPCDNAGLPKQNNKATDGVVSDDAESQWQTLDLNAGPHSQFGSCTQSQRTYGKAKHQVPQVSPALMFFSPPQGGLERA